MTIEYEDTESNLGDPTPEERAAAREVWPHEREHIVYHSRRIREELNQLERLPAHNPNDYRHGSPVNVAILEAKIIAEQARKLVAKLEGSDHE